MSRHIYIMDLAKRSDVYTQQVEATPKHVTVGINPRCPRSQEMPGDLGRYGRRWIISIPSSSCLEGRAGLCPRILVSADYSEIVSEFTTANSTSTSFGEELRSEGPSLTGTDAAVTSSRWIEGWRGYEQQVSGWIGVKEAYVYTVLTL